MLKKSITYTNFENEKITEDFYFNLTKAELLEMDLNLEGGFENYAKNVVASKDPATIMDFFKFIMCKSYGEKQTLSDGKVRFVKSQALSESFASSEMYSELLMEFLTNTQAAIDFVNGIIPKVPEKDSQS